MWARFYLDQYKNIKLESVIFVRVKMIFVASSVDSFRKSVFRRFQEIVPLAQIDIDKR